MTISDLDLVYFADPMCSWCYGFGPELEKVIAHESATRVVKLDLIMGGLRAYNKAVMDDESKDVVREHWQQVTAQTGLPFDGTSMNAPGFVYDTEPACRAVVTGRKLDPSRALALLHAIQRGFYARGLDTTKTDVLARIAAECGYDEKAFLDRFDTAAMKSLTRDDFALTQNVGVNGFPTLCVDGGKQLLLITAGLAKAELVLEGLGRLADQPPTTH
jgi:putative protein-disulfide isomerase